MSDPNWPPPAPPEYAGSEAAGVAPAEGYAGWWRRAGALVIDTVIVAILVYGIGGGARDPDSGLGLTLLFVCFGLAILYPPLTMMRKGAHNGQTFGKQVVGIRVLRDTGAPMGFGWSALRDLLCKYALSFFLLPLVVSYLWPLWDSRNQALHDKMAGTVVGRV